MVSGLAEATVTSIESFSREGEVGGWKTWIVAILSLRNSEKSLNVLIFDHSGVLQEKLSAPAYNTS